MHPLRPLPGGAHVVRLLRAAAQVGAVSHALRGAGGRRRRRHGREPRGAHAFALAVQPGLLREQLWHIPDALGPRPGVPLRPRGRLEVPRFGELLLGADGLRPVDVPLPVPAAPQDRQAVDPHTPTGFTRLGTLQRYSPRLRPRRRQCQEGPRQGAAEGGLTQEEAAEAAEAASERADDPVEELKSAIRWFPGGSLALLAGGVGLRAAGAAASVAGAVVSAEVRIANTAVSVGLRAVDVGVCGAQRAAKTPVGEAALACSERLVRRLPGGGHALDTTRQALVAVGFLAADAETQGIAAAEKLLREASGQAENLKLEAASRLAEMLTRARSLSELEATELMDLVGPELGKVSIALRKRRAGVRAAYQRGCDRAFALGQSLLALSWDLASRLPVVGGTLLRTFERELGELQAQRAGRMPGLQPMAQAYLQLVCSCAMQAVLELRAGLAAPSGMPHEAGPRAPEAGASKHGQAWLLHGGAGDAAGAGAGLGCHDDLAPERSLPSPRRGYARSLSRTTARAAASRAPRRCVGAEAVRRVRPRGRGSERARLPAALRWQCPCRAVAHRSGTMWS
ncbi:unnamed protein product [Prorocentrum cordatum]|uniref:Uncharacterized protein n=1 Tax=Prorocentrum cordatum TaxID=2364126 RepID=A0ABN9RI87_9DINO|nr:unnamed protein product [Polarella glacialis]